MDYKKEFNSLKSEAQAIKAKAKEENRPLTADEKAEYAKRFSRLTEIKTAHDEKKVSDDAVKAIANKAFNKAEAPAKEKNMEASKALEAVESVRKFARGEKIDFNLNSGTNSGVLMPKEIPGVSVTRALTNAVRRAFAALGVAPQINASYSDNMTIPIFNDVGNVANTGQEGVDGVVVADAVTSTNFNLNLVEYHSKAQFISKKLANVGDFDITTGIVPAALSRIERQEESDWITALKTSAGVNTVAASATLIAFTDLTAFDESLVAYAGVPQAILVSPALKLAMRNLKDSSNRPLLDFTNGVETFGGKPVIVSTYLGALTTGQVVGLVIALDGLNGVVIRDTTTNEIVKYENVPTYPGQIGFEALGWSACNGNPAAIGKLTMA